MGGKLRLEERQEPANRGDGRGAVVHQPPGSVEEVAVQPFGAAAHHPLRRGAPHNLVEHREGPGVAIAHVARHAREAGVQHEDADRRPAYGRASGGYRHRGNTLGARLAWNQARKLVRS